MGRTVPTFRHVLDRLEHEWRDYRRGLSTEEQRFFDVLFQRARAHASAGSNVARSEPMETVLLSVLLEHERELARLRGQVAALQEERRTAAGVGEPFTGEGPT